MMKINYEILHALEDGIEVLEDFIDLNFRKPDVLPLLNDVCHSDYI